MTANLSAVADACLRLLDQNDFWVVAGVTDSSFEEGVRSNAFKKPCESYLDAGASPGLLEQLREGVNGNLARLLETSCVPGTVVRNKWKGQDLRFRARAAEVGAAAEVKLVFDCTMPKFFAFVAKDREKLNAWRRAGFEGELFLIVFFLQMPNHDYPGGVWYGAASYNARRHYLRLTGIASQFAEVRRLIPVPPTWPDDPPLVRPLTADLQPANAGLLQRRYDKALKTDAPWRFEPSECLKDAAVGVSIWQIE